MAPEPGRQGAPTAGTRPQLPGENVDAARMPAHWLLARVGKRVLRPGGRRLTLGLLDRLDVTGRDRVVEFAPGVGGTTRLIVARRPAGYTGVERDPRAAAVVRGLLENPAYTCRAAYARSTGLGDSSATVVVGEAYLSMLPDPAKRRIVAEAFRILEPGGRFGLHELALLPDDAPEAEQEAVRRRLSEAVHVGARPLTVEGWRCLLEGAGFVVAHQAPMPMELLRPGRMVQDEGLLRALAIVTRIVRDRRIRARVRTLRRTFRGLDEHICAVGMVARKP
ncbi:MAG: SAM-dependent methyltransferase [Citricoccus sp.]|nr:SAM-dependent methyltransferase [Citricoccus sp. WCRC_4]